MQTVTYFYLVFIFIVEEDLQKCLFCISIPKFLCDEDQTIIIIVVVGHGFALQF